MAFYWFIATYNLSYVDIATIYCKSFKVEKFQIYTDQLVTANFSSELVIMSLQYIRLSCKHGCFLANYTSFLQPRNFSTLNDLQYMVCTLHIAICNVWLLHVCREIFIYVVVHAWYNWTSQMLATYSYVVHYYNYFE